MQDEDSFTKHFLVHANRQALAGSVHAKMNETQSFLSHLLQDVQEAPRKTDSRCAPSE